MKKPYLFGVFSFLIVLQLSLLATDMKAEEKFIGKQKDARYYLIDQNPLEKTIQVAVKKVPNKRGTHYKNYVSFLNLTGAKGDTYNHSIVVYEIDCPNQKIRLMTSTDYDSRGNILFKTSEDPSSPWSPIAAGSMLDKIKQQVCK